MRMYKRKSRTVIPIEREDIPSLEGLRFIARMVHRDCGGEFLGIQYALYFANETYIIEAQTESESKRFNKWLKAKCRSAGAKPKIAFGSIQNFGQQQ